MLKIVGFGSGAKDNMTLEASAAISSAQLIVGYSTYVDILKQYFPDKEYYSTNMMQEKERCQYAIDMAKEGRDVAVSYTHLADIKAVKDGNVWCTTPDFFQIADTIGSMINDINLMLNADADTSELTYLKKLK